MGRRIEKLQVAFVWHLPRWVIKWAVVRAAVQNRDDYPGTITAEEMLKALG